MTTKFEKVPAIGGTIYDRVVSDFLRGAIYRRWGKIEQRLQLIIDRKSYTGFICEVDDLELPWTVKTHMQSPVTKK